MPQQSPMTRRTIRQDAENVRFGSEADICSAKWHVRFTPGRGKSLSLVPFGAIMGPSFTTCVPSGTARSRSVRDDYHGRRMMLTSRFICALAALGALVSGAEAQNTTAPSRWGQGDEIGMANTLGSATWQRCAQSLANPRSKSYEISHLRSNTMPQSPFGVPLRAESDERSQLRRARSDHGPRRRSLRWFA